MNVQSVSGRNKCMCSSSHVLCYKCVWSCVIHNSFASYGGTSFVLVALTRVNVSESEHWVIWSHKTDMNFSFLRRKRIQYFSVSFLTQFFLWCKLHLKNQKFLFTWNHVFESDCQTGLPNNKNCKMFSNQAMKQKIFSIKHMILALKYILL